MALIKPAIGIVIKKIIIQIMVQNFLKNQFWSWRSPCQ